MKGGRIVGLDLESHEFFKALSEDSFWDYVDSQTGPYRISSREWQTVRADGCLALRSDGGRCEQWPREGDPFCPFHLTRALEWFLGRATQEEIRRERARVHGLTNDLRQMVAEARAVLAASPVGPRVYFYELVGQSLVKIGTSRRPEVRVRIFLTGKGCVFPPDADPSTGRLLGHIAGDVEIERALHARFRPQRVVGEWFRLTDEVRASIDSLMDDDRVQAAS